MDNNKTSLGSKILTIAFCSLMVVLTIAAFVYLMTGPDFMSPKEYQELYGTQATEPSGPADIDYEALLYEATMEDLLNYLTELGHINQENKVPMSIVGTDNWICDGLDIIWWDVADLEEGTEPYDYWTQMQTNGFMIFGGSIYAPTLNGPFAINILPSFAGDPNQLREDFANFAQNYLAKDLVPPVDLTAEYEKALWTGTMQDLLDYLTEKGYLDPENKQLLSTVGTENWVISELELIWWDVENLEEGTEPYTYWQDFQKNGFIIFGEMIYAPTLYGPYAVFVRPTFAGDPEALRADLANFGQWLYNKAQQTQ